MAATQIEIRPYARLLTMLGDQLIKNEKIALVEIIKNAYDADATWVKLTFENFTPSFQATADSRIVIEDNGLGMTEKIIKEHWANPATPIKWLEKKNNPKSARGRVIQGEKGIGRFALLKLGRSISIVTRPKGEANEFAFGLDLSDYDENFVSAGRKPLFLEEVKIDFAVESPASIIRERSIELGGHSVKRGKHGTRIEISHLKSAWTRKKVEAIFEDLIRLQSIFLPSLSPGGDEPPKVDDFEVVIYRDSHHEPFSLLAREKLESLLLNNSVLKIENGRFESDEMAFHFHLNGTPVSLSLDDSDLTGLTVFRKHFGKSSEVLKERSLACGSFGFAFYAFDFGADAKGKFSLDSEDKKLIKEHRIYLYRDGVRVYPYGDPDDDWLQIDVYRGTVRASEFLSNDQVVGYVTISQQENPKLQDKTSREGLIDVGDASSDFRELIQIFLAWVRKRPFGQYQQKSRKTHDVEVFKKGLVEEALQTAWEAAAKSDPHVQEQLSKAATLYKAERNYLVHRAETTEHLAGVGLSVETASHDLMSAMRRAMSTIDSMIAECTRSATINADFVQRNLLSVRGGMSFVEAQLKNLQLLFKSTKQRRKDIRVAEVLDRVHRLFKAALDKAKVSFEVVTTGSPLIAKTTDAVLLQLFLNLFDNSLYWLETRNGPRRIVVTLNGDDGTLIFSDDGPGIRKEDQPYIFDPFFTGKGDDGRGLGLYIARQLLERHDYSIDIADTRVDRKLSGANFVVSFVKESAQ